MLIEKSNVDDQVLDKIPVKLDFFDITKISVLVADLPQSVFSVIKEEVDKIQQSNFTLTKKYNDVLAGSIEKEYQLIECANHLNSFIGQIFPYYLQHLGWSKEIIEKNNYFIAPKIDQTGTVTNTPDLWVNFQKKHEYNSLHTHGGEYSFILYVKIPYDLEEEKNLPLNKDQSDEGRVFTNLTFRFLDAKARGGIGRAEIPVDKSYEGKILFFPAWLNHEVMPFYTSEEYRISVSGNINSVQIQEHARGHSVIPPKVSPVVSLI